MTLFEQIQMLLEVMNRLVENFKLVWAGIVILLAVYYFFELGAVVLLVKFLGDHKTRNRRR